jgi:hypothetical protein
MSLCFGPITTTFKPLCTANPRFIVELTLEFILTLLHTPGNYNKISYSTKNDLFTHCLGREDGILPHRYITLPTNPHTSNMPNMAYQPTSSPPSRSISISSVSSSYTSPHSSSLRPIQSPWPPSHTSPTCPSMTQTSPSSWTPPSSWHSSPPTSTSSARRPSIQLQGAGREGQDLECSAREAELYFLMGFKVRGGGVGGLG